MANGMEQGVDLGAATWGEAGALASLDRKLFGTTPIEALGELLVDITPHGREAAFGPSRPTTTAGRRTARS